MRSEPGSDPSRGTRLDRQLGDVAWGLLLIVTGVVWLVPRDQVPEGAWLLGVAAILVGVNVVRVLAHIRVNRFSLVLGLVALAAALTRLWRPDLPVVAVCLLVIGASLVLKPLLGKAS
jgi:hypothetical protein